VKMREGESYEDWCKRVQMYEHGWAMQRIAEGDSVEQVMEQMSKRIMQKLMHPIYSDIKNSVTKPYDADQARADYAEKYLKNRGLVADHVDGQLFDKPV
jgi:hypothetical protein